MDYKKSSYLKILKASTIEEKSIRLINYLSRDDVDPYCEDDLEKINRALFQDRKAWIHLTTIEILIQSIDKIILSSNYKNKKDKNKYKKYLNVIGKLSIFLKEISDFYIEALFEEIKRVNSDKIIIDIIVHLPEKTKILLISRLLESPFCRNNISKLQIYNTFS